jgi:hypothetical protein
MKFETKILQESKQTSASLKKTKDRDLEDLVHDVRVTTKRLRAYFRLAHRLSSLSSREKDQFRSWEGKLRDMAHIFTKSRELDVLQKMIAQLLDEKPKGSRRETLEKLTSQLNRIQRQREKQRRGMAEWKKIQKQWNQFQKDLSVHRSLLKMPQVNSDPIRQSLKKSLRDCRDLYRSCQRERSVEVFHELRKRSKDLEYQVRLVSSSQRALRAADQLKKLNHLLGEVHDLGELESEVQRFKGSSRKAKNWLKRKRKKEMDQASKQSKDFFQKKYKKLRSLV